MSCIITNSDYISKKTEKLFSGIAFIYILDPDGQQSDELPETIKVRYKDGLLNKNKRVIFRAVNPVKAGWLPYLGYKGSQDDINSRTLKIYIPTLKQTITCPLPRIIIPIYEKATRLEVGMEIKKHRLFVDNNMLDTGFIGGVAV